MIHRAYQSDAIAAAYEAWAGHARTLIVMPTGCVAGDTMIGLNRAGKGYSRSISDAYLAQFDARARKDIDTMVRSHVGDRVGLNHARSIVESGSKLTCELSLRNGKVLRATPDHQILTDGGWVALGDLSVRDMVVCESDPKIGGERPRSRKPQYRCVQGLKFHPYAMGVEARTRKNRKPEGRLFRVAMHRLVAESSLNDIEVNDLIDICRNDGDRAASLRFIDPSVWAVHHIDGDHRNNHPCNLQVLTHREHHELHGETGKLSNLGRGLIESSPVSSVRQFGVEPTFDVVCADPHRNFVANGIVVHNCGKTVTFAGIIERWQGRVMVIAHREELIWQAAKTIERVTGETCEIEMGQHKTGSNWLRRPKVIVASKDSLHHRRLNKFDPAEKWLLIIDEAHHAVAKTYQRIIGHFTANPESRVLGVTATPDRLDEKALGQVFESCCFDYEIPDAINDGWLVPIEQRVVAVKGLDFSGVHTVAGDFNQKELAQLMEFEKNLHAVADPIVKLSRWKRTLIFAASIKHAERLCEILNRHRADSARFVCGKTPKDTRRAIIRDFADGKFQFMVNVGVFTEGFDDAALDGQGLGMVAIARPTKSRALYAQMCGRGTRPLPGLVDGLETPEERREAIRTSRKPSLEVLDFEGQAGQHKLVTTADVLGGNYEDDVVEMAAGLMSKADGEKVDAVEALKEAAKIRHEQREAEARREAKKRSRLLAQADFTTRGVNPFDVFNIDPPRRRDWDHTPEMATERQVDALKRWGVPVDGLTKAQARSLIGECIRRRRDGLCTYRQAQQLKKRGHDPDVSFEEAKRIMDSIAAREGWGKKVGV